MTDSEKNMIDKIDTKNLCQFLLLNQWTESQRLYDGRVRQFSTPDAEDAIMLPTQNCFSDFYEVMLRSLNRIAEVEKKSLTELFNILMHPTSDILKWRIENHQHSLGTISFDAMSENIENIRNLLGSAYHDMICPEVFHKTVMTQRVKNQISLYEFGQTEIGSYILNLVAPLGCYQYKLFDEKEDLPINRRINLQMLTSINEIQQSVKENSSVLDEVVASGKISVNFLSALAKVYENNKESNMEISAIWNEKVPMTQENPIRQILLRPLCSDKVSEIVEKYTPIQEQNIHKTYYGKITKIYGAPDISNREKLNITVATIGEDGQKMSVQVDLDNSTYSHVVTTAFENGINVRVSGICSVSAKSTKMEKAEIESLD